MRKIPTVLVVVIVCAALIKIVLASRTVGTNDVLFFQAYLEKASAEGGAALYRDGIVLEGPERPRHPEPFQHPPFILHLLEFLRWAQTATGLSFPFLFRFLSIAADVASAYIVWRILGRPLTGRSLAASCVFAGSPVLVMLSGFHGNTDPLMV